MSNQFGYKEKLVFNIGPLDATSIATNTDKFVIPANAGCAYEVESIQSVQSVASTSGTLKIRVITDTTAPGAAASSTCVELVSAISTASTANTVVTATKVAGVRILPGNRIATLSGGTQTNLVGFHATVTLRPVVESGS